MPTIDSKPSSPAPQPEPAPAPEPEAAPVPAAPAPAAPSHVCRATGCARKVLARGLCGKHYDWWRKGRQPVPGVSEAYTPAPDWRGAPRSRRTTTPAARPAAPAPAEATDGDPIPDDEACAFCGRVADGAMFLVRLTAEAEAAGAQIGQSALVCDDCTERAEEVGFSDEPTERDGVAEDAPRFWETAEAVAR